MSFVASMFTNPAELISFPIVMFEAAMKFGMAMMNQSSEFVLGIFRLMV